MCTPDPPTIKKNDGVTFVSGSKVSTTASCHFRVAVFITKGKFHLIFWDEGTADILNLRGRSVA